MKELPPIKEEIDQKNHLSDLNAIEEYKAIKWEGYEKRKEIFSKSLLVIKIFLLWTFSFIVVSWFAWMLFVWVIHLTGPENIRWLTDESDLKRIESILVGLGIGSIGTFLTNSLLKDR